MPTPPTTKGMRIKKINAFSQARMMRMLCDGPCTCMEMAEETGLHYVTVQEYMREMRRAGAAHIAAWEKDSRGRDSIKVYALGPGKDAKRRKMTGAERQAATRARRKLAIIQTLGQSSLDASSVAVGL